MIKKTPSRILAGALLLGTSLLILSGCAGSGNNSGGTALANPYATYFSGQALDNSGNYTTVTLLVSAKGAIQGTSVNDGINSVLSGSIQNSGQASVTSSAGGTLTGMFTTPNASTMSATLTNASGTQTEYMIVCVNPLPGVTTTNAFAGAFAGTYSDATTTKTSPICVVVDSNGNITGTALTVTASASTIANLAGTVTTGGVCSITESVNGSAVDTLTGTLNRAGSTVTGSLTNTAGDVISPHLLAVSEAGH